MTATLEDVRQQIPVVEAASRLPVLPQEILLEALDDNALLKRSPNGSIGVIDVLLPEPPQAEPPKSSALVRVAETPVDDRYRPSGWSQLEPEQRLAAALAREQGTGGRVEVSYWRSQNLKRQAERLGVLAAARLRRGLFL